MLGARVGLCALLALLLLGPSLAGAAPAAGIGLGLFASDPEWDYAPLLDEIEQLGVSRLLLVSPWYQHDVRSTVIRPLPGSSPSLQTVARTLAQARARGLAVTLMPIVLLEHAAHPTEWRGVLAPEHEGGDGLDRWFTSYRDVVLAHAVLAAQHGAERLIVGSELLSLQGEEARWRALIAEARAAFPGELYYSANWDRYEDVPFWDALDGIGVNAYFRLGADGERPAEDALVAAWAPHLLALARLREELGLPLMITEVGYSNRSTAAAKPWCACPGEELDPELQARLYRALLRVFVDGESPVRLPFDGWFLWNWFGHAGPEDGTFTPRGKPAGEVLRDGLSGLRGPP